MSRQRSFPKTTHCVDLSESTIEANARFFDSEDEVPRQAYTMGIQSIMQAKMILIMACGADKKRNRKESILGTDLSSGSRFGITASQ